MKDETRTMIWPAYIDSKRTQREGRKIPQNDAVSSPKLREISGAALKMGLHPEVENDKSYSKSWWESSGRVIVDRKMSKRELLLKISSLIKASRE